MTAEAALRRIVQVCELRNPDPVSQVQTISMLATQALATDKQRPAGAGE